MMNDAHTTPRRDGQTPPPSEVHPTEHMTSPRHALSERTTERVARAAPAPPPPPPAEGGETTVADGVVARVAELAAREVGGVHELVRRGSRDPLLRLLQRLASGAKQEPPGVVVKVGGHEVAISLTLIVDYGVSIPQVVEAVRASVIGRVQALTGLAVREVTIDVTDLHFPDGPPRP